MNDDTNLKQPTNKGDNNIEEKPEEPTENKKVIELQEKIKELENNWRRALADYQNLQKRIAVDNQEIFQYGSKNLFIKFLDILDHLEEAQKHLNDKGIELVIKLFKDYLKEEGVEEKVRLGEKFDPIYDECVDKKVGEKDNVVIEVKKKCYLYKLKVLRVAKVVVEVNK